MAKLTLEQKNKRKLTQIRNSIIRSAKYREENFEKEIYSALFSGQKEIEITFTAFEMEFTNHYNISRMISSISADAYIHIEKFIKKENVEHYSRLLNGFFMNVMADLASVKYKAKNDGYSFDTDICLNILFAMTYCSDELIDQLILKLPFFKENQVEENKTPIFFSAHNLLPMVYYFYSHRYPEKPFPLDVHDSVDSKDKPINPDIYENISPVYRNIIDNLYTDDDKAFGDMVITMCDYHLENSKDNFLLEFNHIEWQYFPIEILFLLKERHKKGKSIEGISHLLIDDFLPYFLNEFEISEQNQQILKLILE